MQVNGALLCVAPPSTTTLTALGEIQHEALHRHELLVEQAVLEPFGVEELARGLALLLEALAAVGLGLLEQLGVLLVRDERARGLGSSHEGQPNASGQAP
jgi:hypothetical protein